jgi:hypothetical protein
MKNQRARAWPATAFLTGLLLLSQACSPPPINRERAAKLITEQKLPEPVESFSYRLDDGFRYRLLEACEQTGAITLEGEGLDLELRITPAGREHFRRVMKTRVGETLQYTLEFRTPVTSRLVVVTALQNMGPRNKQVGYTWRYDCPPLLARCTTLNSEPRPGTARIYAVKDRWKVK